MKFIRLDEKGTWKGTEHISSFTSGATEHGISCYSLEGETDEDLICTVKDLYKYWTNIACMGDFSEFQLTIFDGKKLDRVGYDMEDIALCTETIKQVDADPFMSRLCDIEDMKDGLYEDPETGDFKDEIDEDEANKLILNLIKSELEEKILEN